MLHYYCIIQLPQVENRTYHTSNYSGVLPPIAVVTRLFVSKSWERGSLGRNMLQGLDARSSMKNQTQDFLSSTPSSKAVYLLLMNSRNLNYLVKSEQSEQSEQSE